MTDGSTVVSPVYRAPNAILIWIAVSAVGLGIAFQPALARMAATWMESEEYSFGILIPLIVAFIVWQKKNELARIDFVGAWSGLFLVCMGAALNLLGRFATVFALQQYAFVVAIVGVAVCLGGWRVVRRLTVPFLLLLFMVPLPNFFLNGMSSQLRLWSSELGVAFLRVFGTSVYLEGNVIDLGSYKLQVADACSGLRYLFPLMTMGFVMAYFFSVSMWKRALVFVSSIPITVVLNSLRIAFIGLTVERWGNDAAEGFLHDFEGWAVFMVSVGVLLVEMIVLTRIGGTERPWREVFGVEWPTRKRQHTSPGIHRLSAPLIAAGIILVVYAVGTVVLPQRLEAVPSRTTFAEFPAQLDGRRAQRSAMEPIFVDALRFDDYLLADYRRPGSAPINTYVAWYNSQSAGQSAHSPRSCIPAGGWRIEKLDTVTIADVRVGKKPLAVNRALIVSGEQRQLVYYWFQQRGRVITNEYAVKWYLFWDGLTRSRSDGALVRLIVPLRDDASLEAAERDLNEFTAALTPELSRFIPN